MNKYEELESKLKRIKCKNCHGSGKCDDAEPGDISFREWSCPECNGTGVIEEDKIK